MRAYSALLAAALAFSLPGSICSAQTPSTSSDEPATTKFSTAPEIIFYNGVIYTGVGMN